jgi:hypothetical protein
MPGLVNIRLFNRSASQQHFSILKVDRPLFADLDYCAAAIERAGSTGGWPTPAGGVSFVPMVLEPGRYVIAQLLIYLPGGPLILGEVEEPVTRHPGAIRRLPPGYRERAQDV